MHYWHRGRVQDGPGALLRFEQAVAIRRENLISLPRFCGGEPSHDSTVCGIWCRSGLCRTFRGLGRSELTLAVPGGQGLEGIAFLVIGRGAPARVAQLPWPLRWPRTACSRRLVDEGIAWLLVRRAVHGPAVPGEAAMPPRRRRRRRRPSGWPTTGRFSEAILAACRLRADAPNSRPKRMHDDAFLTERARDGIASNPW
jgi:hypothetical protein